MTKRLTMRRRQFRVLYHVFLLRVVDLELMSANGDPNRLLGQFATIFSGISLLFALPGILFVAASQRMALEEAWMAEHFFIATMLTVVGVITVLNWESAFPDRRDVLVLGALPVRASTLFLAKISALFAAPALAVVGLNIFSGLVWPAIFSSRQAGFWAFVRVWPAYWATMAAVGVFTVFRCSRCRGWRPTCYRDSIFCACLRFCRRGFFVYCLVSIFLNHTWSLQRL
jgi:hypothetical protein